jgi:hypothetical protein
MQYLHRTCRLVAISLVLAACHADTVAAPTSPSPLIVDPCPADPYAPDCPPPPPPPPPEQQGLDIGYTWDSCKTPVADLDRDGLDDECERRLGAAFAPDLVMNAFECNWDWQLNKMGGEYLYAVQYIVDPSGPRYRIVYMPGWYRDCGDVATGAGGHGGDSEFIIVDVGFRALESWRSPTWQTLQVFLSAHCGAWNGRDCQWWDAGWWEREGRWVNGVRYGAPVVWVSNAKHANYYSKGKCFTGSLGADDCLNNGRTVRYPIQYAWQNVGSFTVPYAFESVPNDYAANGIPARLGSSFTQPWAREHFWKTADADFRGWRGYDGSTPYGKTLRDVAHFFTDPIYTPPPPPPCPTPASVTPGTTTTASLLLTCPL